MSEQTEATTAAAPVDNGQAGKLADSQNLGAATKPRRAAATKPEPVTLPPAAEAAAPCADCAEREGGLEDRLGRLEQAHAALAKLVVAAAVAAAVVYFLAGRTETKQE